LYEDDLNPQRNLAVADQFTRRRLADEELLELAQSLIYGVRRNRAELDQMLAERADNWSLERMAVIDRNILRMGAYESGRVGQAVWHQAVGQVRQRRARPVPAGEGTEVILLGRYPRSGHQGDSHGFV
jgi:hypothetical protein